jgi:hypothetical protein
MGYDLHIIRRKNYEDFEEESNISLEEWLAYIETDKSLELTNGYQVKIPGFAESYQNVPGFCNWKEHSANKGESAPWLDFGHGQISSKNSDDETIRKMIAIAKLLNGKVIGDDWEEYDESFFDKEKVEERKKSLEKFNPEAVKITRLDLNKPWWKFW